MLLSKHCKRVSQNKSFLHQVGFFCFCCCLTRNWSQQQEKYPIQTGWSILHYLYQKVVSPGSEILVPGHTIFIIIKSASHNASLARENRAFLKIINGLRRTRVTNNTEALRKVYPVQFFFKSHKENLSSVLVYD